MREPSEFPPNPMTDPLAPHWIPTYVPARSMPENVFSLARRVFGKTMAEWALLLARDVAEAVPESSNGKDAPEWAAAVLRCAAIKMEMDEDLLMWEHIEGDIYDMTNVPPAIARRRWRQLSRRGLTVPKYEPPWFRADDSAEGMASTTDEIYSRGTSTARQIRPT
jgi:hypothetical protein